MTNIYSLRGFLSGLSSSITSFLLACLTFINRLSSKSKKIIVTQLSRIPNSPEYRDTRHTRYRGRVTCVLYVRRDVLYSRVHFTSRVTFEWTKTVRHLGNLINIDADDVARAFHPPGEFSKNCLSLSSVSSSPSRVLLSVEFLVTRYIRSRRRGVTETDPISPRIRCITTSLLIGSSRVALRRQSR